MKILATMLTWNNIEFFKRALRQALDFCDEVIVIEGCHSRQFPKRSTDGTVEYLATIKNPKLKILDIDYKRIGLEGRRYDIVQCELWNIANKSFDSWESGNWMVRWDDDCFWFNEDLGKIRRILETTEYDRVNFRERYFTYNFRFNVLNAGVGHRFDRITDGCYYTPIARLHYKDGKEYSNSLPHPKIVMFHYTGVKKAERMKARWILSVERGTRSSRDRFERWVDFKWDVDDDIIKNEEFMMYVVGIRKSKEKSKVNVYDGKHPEVLGDHPWRYIEDVRTIK